MHCRTEDGKTFYTLNIIDEYSRECLAIRVDRKLYSGNVIDALLDTDLVVNSTFFAVQLAKTGLVVPPGRTLLVEDEVESSRPLVPLAIETKPKKPFIWCIPDKNEPDEMSWRFLSC